MKDLLTSFLLVTVAIVEVNSYGKFTGAFKKKEPQRSNKLRRMLNRRIRKREFIFTILSLFLHFNIFKIIIGTIIKT